VDSHYRISLLFFRIPFNAVICLCFRVNRKKARTTIQPERSFVFGVLLEKVCRERNGTDLQRLELCGITVYTQKETVGLCGVEVSDFTECQHRQ